MFVVDGCYNNYGSRKLREFVYMRYSRKCILNIRVEFLE